MVGIRTGIGISTCLVVPIIIEIIFRLLPDRLLNENEKWKFAYLQYHKFVPYLFLMATLIIVIVINNHFDPKVTEAIKLNFTPQVHSIEGNKVAELQDWMMDSVHSKRTLYFRLIYTYTYGALFYVFLFWFIFKDDVKMVKMITAGHVISYSIAAPFFALIPVDSAWTTNPKRYSFYEGEQYSDKIVGVLHDMDPGFTEVHQVFASINNCFPSLHTAVPVMIFLILLFTGHKYLAAVTFPVMVSIIISTIYLGIHWITDLIAGIILAIFVTYIVINLDYKLDFPMNLRYIKWKEKFIYKGKKEIILD